MADSLVRVLVVDDSPTARAVIARTLAADERIEVIGKAVDGLDALAQVERLKPDVVTLDIEMPRLDGLQTLERLMEQAPTPVVMVSSLTRKGADATLRALELGAVDFVEKPTRDGLIIGSQVGGLGLCDKIVAAAGARVRRGRPAVAHPAPPRPQEAPRTPPAGAAAGDAKWQRRTVVIGSSTGGPQALHTVLAALPGDLGVPVVVVQHMPAGFTHSLAERLNSLSPLQITEAKAGDRLEAGRVLIAPGGYHLVFDAHGVARLDDGPAECGVRPAANVTMESIARARGFSTIAVVLTGMGTDGTRGAQLIHEAGGTVLAQDEASCVVYGMPRSVAQAGIVDEVHPLDEMADAIVRRCMAAVSPRVRRAS